MPQKIIFCRSGKSRKKETHLTILQLITFNLFGHKLKRKKNTPMTRLSLCPIPGSSIDILYSKSSSDFPQVAVTTSVDSQETGTKDSVN